MNPFEKLKGLIKETWTCINEGGVAISSKWKPDTELRAAAQTFGGTNANIEGGLFLDDLKEFYAAIDRFNATRAPSKQFSVVVHEDIANDLASKVTAEKQSMLGYGAIGPIGLERNGRVFEGRYFSDMVYSSGFAFTCQGKETKFLCGLEEKTDFGKFATKLLNPPPMYPHPVLPRMI